MRRLALSVIVVAAALVLQLTVVDRLPLPGGGPDLVLIAVVALGLTSGPMAGMLTGFLAGLALDIAPPASGVLGEHALVFCVVGYGCGRLSGLTDRSAASSLGVAAVAAAAGEILYVAVGLTLGDPGISWPAIRSVLPSSVLQDVLISPFVVFGIWKASSPTAGYSLGPAAGAAAAGLRAGLAGPGPGRLASGAVLPARAGLLGRASWLAGPLGSGRGKKAGPVGSVRFGKSAARQGDGWVGSGPRALRPAQAQVRRGRRPRLRPGAGQAGSAAMVQLHRRRPAPPVSVRMSHRRRGDGSIGAGLLAAAPGRRNPPGAAVRPARQPRFRSGSGSLGGQAGRTGPGGARPGGAGLGGARLGGAGPRGAGLTGRGLGGAGFTGRGAGGAGLGGRGLGGPGFRSSGQGRKGLGRTRLGRKGVGRKGLGRTRLGRAGLGGPPPGSSLPGSSLRGGGTTRRGAVARSVSLHLRGGRRGDGVVGGGSPRRPPGPGRAGTRPRKQPRFFRRRPRLPGRRPRPAGRGPSFSGRQLSFPRRRPRLRSGRPSFLASRASGKAARRRPAWRAGGGTGGFR
jgi:rod shape-determining protein MreD